MTDAPSSRVSSVVSMLGDFNAFCASFLILDDVIAAGALAIAQFYVEGRVSGMRQPYLVKLFWLGIVRRASTVRWRLCADAATAEQETSSASRKNSRRVQTFRAVARAPTDHNIATSTYASSHEPPCLLHVLGMKEARLKAGVSLCFRIGSDRLSRCHRPITTPLRRPFTKSSARAASAFPQTSFPPRKSAECRCCTCLCFTASKRMRYQSNAQSSSAYAALQRIT